MYVKKGVLNTLKKCLLLQTIIFLCTLPSWLGKLFVENHENKQDQQQSDYDNQQNQQNQPGKWC